MVRCRAPVSQGIWAITTAHCHEHAFSNPCILMVPSQPGLLAVPGVDISGQGLQLRPLNLCHPFMESRRLEKTCGALHMVSGVMSQFDPKLVVFGS